MTAVIRRALYALRARTLKRRIRYWVGFIIVLLSLCMAASLYVIEINNTEEQLLEHTSFIDQLTGVYNRRYIMNEGSRLLESSLAAGKPCSVIMADIDRFKSINDTYGHVVGDRIIRYFSNLLKMTNSPTGNVIVSRYGGEEFLLLLIGVDAAAAERYAEWVRSTLEISLYRGEELEIAVTASFGISSYEGAREFGTTILEDLVARADYALYEAKRQGRNRTVAYGGGLGKAMRSLNK